MSKQEQCARCQTLLGVKFRDFDGNITHKRSLKCTHCGKSFCGQCANKNKGILCVSCDIKLKRLASQKTQNDSHTYPHGFHEVARVSIEFPGLVNCQCCPWKEPVEGCLGRVKCTKGIADGAQANQSGCTLLETINSAKGYTLHVSNDTTLAFDILHACSNCVELIKEKDVGRLKCNDCKIGLCEDCVVHGEYGSKWCSICRDKKVRAAEQEKEKEKEKAEREDQLDSSDITFVKGDFVVDHLHNLGVVVDKPINNFHKVEYRTGLDKGRVIVRSATNLTKTKFQNLDKVKTSTGGIGLVTDVSMSVSVDYFVKFKDGALIIFEEAELTLLQRPKFKHGDLVVGNSGTNYKILSVSSFYWLNDTYDYNAEVLYGDLSSTGGTTVADGSNLKLIKPPSPPTTSLNTTIDLKVGDQLRNKINGATSTVTKLDHNFTWGRAVEFDGCCHFGSLDKEEIEVRFSDPDPNEEWEYIPKASHKFKVGDYAVGHKTGAVCQITKLTWLTNSGSCPANDIAYEVKVINPGSGKSYTVGKEGVWLEFFMDEFKPKFKPGDIIKWDHSEVVAEILSFEGFNSRGEELYEFKILSDPHYQPGVGKVKTETTQCANLFKPKFKVGDKVASLSKGQIFTIAKANGVNPDGHFRYIAAGGTTHYLLEPDLTLIP